MIKAVIIDDEQHCVEGLYLQLKQLKTKVRVIEKFTSPVKAAEYLRENPFIADLVFLDIAMPHLDGFEMLKKIGAIHFKLIFTTAFDQFAIKAFEVSAFDYLLKPIEDENLLRAIEKYEDFVAKEQRERLDLLLRYRDPNITKDDKLAFPTQEGYELVNANEISYCKALSNYCEIALKSERTILISKTLKQVELILTDFGFVRIHKSYLVHPTSIQKIIKADGGSVVLKSGEHLPISKTTRNELLSTLKMIGREINK